MVTKIPWWKYLHSYPPITKISNLAETFSLGEYFTDIYSKKSLGQKNVADPSDLFVIALNNDELRERWLAMQFLISV